MTFENSLSNEEASCCGMHVLSCAKFVAIVGIVYSLFSIISAIFLWYYIPFAFLSFLVFLYVFIGIQVQRPSFLLPGIILLSIDVFLNILTFIALLVIGIIAPLNLAETRAIETDGDIQRARAVIRSAYLITAVFVFLSLIYNIFALTVIKKARNFMILSSQMPLSFSSTEYPSTQFSSNLPPSTVPPTTVPSSLSPKATTQPPPPYSETL